MGFKRFYDRDGGKWAHPELVSIYESVAAAGGFDTVILNESLPIEERRKFVEKYMSSFANQEDNNPENKERITTVMVPGCPEEEDAPLIKMTIAYPKELKRKKLPCLFLIPGGGLSMCITDPSPLAMADTYNCIAVTFEYRTIVYGGKYPETINDCHAAYKYVTDHAEEYHINSKKIILYGNSSGGHLALALSHRLKKYNYNPRGCIVFVPPIDERNIYPSSHIKSTAWGTAQSYMMSKQWLGKDGNEAFVPAEAFPNHASVEECVGLPPTFIHAFANDIYSDPCMQYASKLNEAGVYVGIHMWHGTNHDALYTAYGIYKGSSDYPYANIFGNVVENEIKDCIAYDLRRPWTVEEVADELQKRVEELIKK